MNSTIKDSSAPASTTPNMSPSTARSSPHRKRSSATCCT